MQHFTRSTFRHWRRFATTAAVVVALVACSSDSDGIRDASLTNVDVRGTIVAVDAGLPNDAITVDSVRIVGDTLAAVVSHGGGCAVHSYQLVIGTAWMESFPVQVRARIAHNANADVCRALLRRELRMGLQPLAEAYRKSYKQEHGTVSIQLAGSNNVLWYVF